MSDAWDVQIGGDHYKKLEIQPMEYSMANGLDPLQHTIVKYATRFRDKGTPIEDLRKGRHCFDMLIDRELGLGFGAGIVKVNKVRDDTDPPSNREILRVELKKLRETLEGLTVGCDTTENLLSAITQVQVYVEGKENVEGK